MNRDDLLAMREASIRLEDELGELFRAKYEAKLRETVKVSESTILDDTQKVADAFMVMLLPGAGHGARPLTAVIDSIIAVMHQEQKLQ